MYAFRHPSGEICDSVPTRLQMPARRHRGQDSGAPRQRASPSNTPARDAEYAHLSPLLAEYAALAPTDPRRYQLRDELVSGYLPVARHIARRFVNRGEPLDDLIQVATLGLIFAIDRFRTDFGSDFLAFAVPTMQGEVRRYFRDRGWSMRVPRRLKDLHVSINAAISELSQRFGHAPRPSEIAELLGISMAEVLEGLEASGAYRACSLDEQISPEADGSASVGDQLGELDPELEFVEDQHALRPLLEALPERERGILMMRFYGNMSQTQIATRIGISQMHVSRLLAQTLTQLRTQMRDES
ncbi:MAG TPA: RNA polymerase sigma factor SigF [Pseudonocardia sp.]|jgi:RNA polymerase sigma-B factor|uniref:RNA polymerase sigma factor SigF n=1 Tax=Pseudonocardia sp. TaxID=60912 RepID=UPI002ED7ECA9